MCILDSTSYSTPRKYGSSLLVIHLCQPIADRSKGSHQLPPSLAPAIADIFPRFSDFLFLSCLLFQGMKDNPYNRSHSSSVPWKIIAGGKRGLMCASGSHSLTSALFLSIYLNQPSSKTLTGVTPIIKASAAELMEWSSWDSSNLSIIAVHIAR